MPTQSGALATGSYERYDPPTMNVADYTTELDAPLDLPTLHWREPVPSTSCASPRRWRHSRRNTPGCPGETAWARGRTGSEDRSADRPLPCTRRGRGRTARPRRRPWLPRHRRSRHGVIGVLRRLRIRAARGYWG